MILRTHAATDLALRRAGDIRWMLALTAARVRASIATYTRSLGLDESTLERCSRVIAQALRGGKSLTRAELGTILRDAGLPATDGATSAACSCMPRSKGWCAAGLVVDETTPTRCWS